MRFCRFVFVFVVVCALLCWLLCCFVFALLHHNYFHFRGTAGTTERGPVLERIPQHAVALVPQLLRFFCLLVCHIQGRRCRGTKV